LLVFHATVTLDTGRPLASSTFAVNGSGSLVPTCTEGCASPETTTMLAGGFGWGPDASPQAIVIETIDARNAAFR
jgi:hypothetical protein